MKFKKLAIATAIAAVFTPVAGMAAMVEVADDELSQTVAQAGISAALVIGGGGISTNIYIHDKDGIPFALSTPTSYSFAGAIIVETMQVAVGGATITINVDAGANQVSTGAPVLNVNVSLPTTLTISTGAIRVANSQRDDGAPAWGFDAAGLTGTIINNMTIILGSTTLNIQLGNESQTGGTSGSDMAVLQATVNNGIIMSGFRVSDANSGGGIGASTMTIIDTAGGTSLNLKVDANVTSAGLVLGLAQIGTAAGMDIRIADQYLGTSTNAKLGDLAIIGLNVNGSTLTINGK